MDSIDTERIKSKFYAKLKEEENMKSKKAKLTSIIVIAAIISLTSISVLAANLGVFNNFFSNFNDVINSVKATDAKAESNGVTMTLSSYLADNMGIVLELVFTKEDGSSFASDMAASHTEGFREGNPSIKINDRNRIVSPQNKVSEDGKTYYCLPIVYYDIEQVKDSSVDISVDKLLYNIEESRETVDIDLYAAYKKADVKTYDLGQGFQNDELKKIFDGVSDNPIETNIGATIDAVVFARVKAYKEEVKPGRPPADGVDAAALSTEQYDNIIAFKFTRSVKKEGMEYSFQPTNLVNNNDPLGMCLGIDGETSYQFFRVSDFDDLKNMNGINFIVGSNSYITGDWHIKASFSANQNLSTVAINKRFIIEDLNTTITLTKAEVSLFSTKLSYEVRDSEGKLVENISGYDMNVYYLKSISENEVKLLYSDGSEINLINSFGGASDGGIFSFSYNIEMDADKYTLMNTSKLSAIVINGDSFTDFDYNLDSLDH